MNSLSCTLVFEDLVFVVRATKTAVYISRVEMQCLAEGFALIVIIAMLSKNPDSGNLTWRKGFRTVTVEMTVNV